MTSIPSTTQPQSAVPPAPPAAAPPGREVLRPDPQPAAPAAPRRGRRAALPAPPGAAGDAEPVTAMPPLPPGHKLLEVTPIVPGRAWSRLLHDEADHSLVYEVVEPALDATERAVLAYLRDTLERTLDGEAALQGDPKEALLAAARAAVAEAGLGLREASLARVEYHLVRDFLGYGRIDVLMRDPMIEDISCDGPGIPVFLFHRRHEALPTRVVFPDEGELDSFVIRLAQRSRKHISIADPLLDATLPDGSRLQATLSREVTTRGSSFTIRKFPADPMTPPDLLQLGTMSAEMAAWFWFAMELGHSLILAGGTASGKTTSLNAVAQFIPPQKKIVSIEDTREINLGHPNWIAGVTRSGFGAETRGGKQAGTIDMYKLLEAALRQRPEYLLVGEVRGAEAVTLFQAMATGHAVYSTMHADSVPSAVYRLENPPISVPRMMLQTLDVLAIQAQVRIGARMGRRIREVTEFAGFDPETKELMTNTVFEWDPATDQHRYFGKSVVLEHVAEARQMTEQEVFAEWRNRAAVLRALKDRGVRHVGDVARVIRRYYLDPKGVLESLGLRPAEVRAHA